jgi:hypothetical protein
MGYFYNYNASTCLRRLRDLSHNASLGNAKNVRFDDFGAYGKEDPLAARPARLPCARLFRQSVPRDVEGPFECPRGRCNIREKCQKCCVLLHFVASRYTEAWRQGREAIVDISMSNRQAVCGVSVPHPTKSHMGRW